ncbi:MAG: hypothetical protein ACI4R9_02685 [Kiritimatiellia bacterium]
MSIMMIVGVAAGMVLVLVAACVILAAMFPPKEYKGDVGAVGDADSSGKTPVLFIGRQEALAEKAKLRESAADSDLSIRCVELDPATLGHGWVARMSAKRELRSLVRDVGPNGAVVLLECPGDKAWAAWMVYVVEGGFKRVAVPARLLDAGQISAVRSGVASYGKLDTLDDLEEIVRGTLWEAQKLAYASK